MSKKLTIGPLGFPLPDKLASIADAAIKGLPKDIRDRFKTTVANEDGTRTTVDGYCRTAMTVKAMDFSDGERADISVITSGAVDSDKEVVLPRGLDFDQFRKAPAVQLCHNYAIPSIAKCLWIKLETIEDGNEAWKAKSAYLPRPSDFPAEQEWLPETTWFYVREKLLNGKSIGFIPLSIKDISPDDVRANPDWADAYCIIDKALVLEYSVCPIGANPDALVESAAKMKAKGISCKSLTDALGLIIPETIPSIEPEVKKKGPPIEIKSFVTAKTITDAAEKRARESLKGIPELVTARLVDRLDKEMGRV